MIGKVARNTFFLSASQILARLVGFLYFVFLARALGVKDFGVYVFTTAFIYNFVPVADFGIERLVLRDISREPAKANYYLARLLPLRVFLAVAAYVAVIVLGLILGQTLTQILFLAVFGLALIPYNLTFLFSSFLNAREKMGYMAIANIALALLTTIFGILSVLVKQSLAYVLFAYPLANWLLAGFFISNSKKWGVALGWVIDRKFWRQSLVESWIFASLTILAVFYLRTSTVMINLLKGPEATGIYGSAFKFVEAMILIPQSLALALFPLSSKLIAQDKNKLRNVYLKGLGVLFFSSLPFAFVLVALPKFIIRFSYGTEYLSAVPIFAILGFSLILFFVNALAGNIIQNSIRVKKFLPLLLLNFIVEIVLCLILISRLGTIGAAWAVVGGEVFGLFINNIFVFQILRKNEAA